MKYIITLLLILLAGCSSIDGDPRHDPGNYSKHYKWLPHYERIKASNRPNKAKEFAQWANISGHPAKVVRGRFVWVQNPMINSAHLVDIENGRMKRCDSERWIDYTIKKEGW